ncbi:CCR4-NOT transcription complex subunit 10-like [Triticum urartu]|uniref:CCR4-NOT transcription complex subunit 10 n=3 Tax=Triticum urartu TaxID=4572 RepID=A0A8R7UHR0_TRIUA|nr:CCR4-NOT transcription complex subunit 10-like [Triticum urartu]
MEPAAPKEAPPPQPQPGVEEDGTLSATAAMARDAAVLFQSRRYAECADVLAQLLLKKEGDPKVLHNMAIAESFVDGCPDPKKLLEILGNVKIRSDELACASREQADSANGVGNNTSSEPRGSGIAPLISAAHNATAYGDEFDTTIITFNTALILYHLHDYESALSVLEPLYRNIEPIDETTALHVCFLLLDITLALQDASKAADVIQYLERSFGVANTGNQNEIASTVQQQPAQLKPAKSNTPPDSDSNTCPGGSEILSVGSFSDDTLEFESFYSTLDGGNHLGRPILNEFSRASADLAATAADLKVRLQIYKVRLLLLTRNLKVAKRELKVLMNMARGRDSSTELLLKSQLEYARGNYRKAVKLLSTPNNRTEPVMLTMFYNNLGCILHQQRSNHTSVLCFSKALKYSLSLRSEKPLKLSALSQDKSCLISYNCGIQHLMCGKPLLAARCFREAMPLLYHRPLFWLRFAECSLLALEMGFLTASGATSCKDEIEIYVVGSGKWRHLVISPVNSGSHLSDFGSSGEHGNLISLRFARQCLLNAQLLMDASEQKKMAISDTEECNQGSQCQKSSGQSTMSVESKVHSGPTTNANGEQKGAASLNATLQSSLAMYDDIIRKENLKIRQAILGDLAFVELCLENPLKALSIANSLLQVPDCSRMYLFLGHVYAAEALCLLNRLKEAVDQLTVYLRDDNAIELPYSVENREKAPVEKDSDGEDSVTPAMTKLTSEESQHSMSLKPEEACGVLYVDLGMTAAVQGELEQANYLVSRGFAMLPNSPRALLASIYVDLLQGKAQEAIGKLRRCRNVRFKTSSVAASR